VTGERGRTKGSGIGERALAGSEIGDEGVAAQEAAAAAGSKDSSAQGVERLLADLAVVRHSSDREGVVSQVELDGAVYTLHRRPLGLRREEPALSAREQEIARMVALGYTNRAIAAVLDISSWTVSTHLRRIYSKLDVHSRSAMVARLVEEGTLRRVGRSPNWARLWRPWNENN